MMFDNCMSAWILITAISLKALSSLVIRSALTASDNLMIPPINQTLQTALELPLVSPTLCRECQNWPIQQLVTKFFVVGLLSHIVFDFTHTRERVF